MKLEMKISDIEFQGDGKKVIFFYTSEGRVDFRELVKDLERIKGDFAQNYQTIAVKYGEHFTKILITILVVLTLNPIYFLLKYPLFVTVVVTGSLLPLLLFSSVTHCIEHVMTSCCIYLY